MARGLHLSGDTAGLYLPDRARNAAPRRRYRLQQRRGGLSLALRGAAGAAGKPGGRVRLRCPCHPTGPAPDQLQRQRGGYLPRRAPCGHATPARRQARALYQRGARPGLQGHDSGREPALNRYLTERIAQSEFTFRLTWEKDMVALWDNRLVHHHAVNDYHGALRVMDRITVNDRGLEA
nr:TauD/TfdA family dioxygenase [Salinicola tamaricis]